MKKLYWAVLWWFVGGLICVLLNLALIPPFGGIGAAITQSVSFACTSLGIFATSQAKFRIQLDWIRLASAMTIVLVASFFLAPSWYGIASLSLLMKLPFMLIIMIIVSWITAPDWSVRVIERLRRLNSIPQGKAC